jgi:hypothetical protein
MLMRLGIDLSTTTEGQHGRKKVKIKNFEEKWQSQFKKLKDYHRLQCT